MMNMIMKRIIKAGGKGAEVFNKEDSTKVSGEWEVGSGKYSPGYYIIEIETKDKNGETS